MKHLINVFGSITGLLILALLIAVLTPMLREQTRVEPLGVPFRSPSIPAATPTPHYTPLPVQVSPVIPIPTSVVPSTPWPSPTPLPPVPTGRRPGFWTENLVFSSPRLVGQSLKDPFGQITWSPDGNQFAFSLFTGEFIRDEAGQPVWEVTQIALFHLSDGSLTPLVRGFLPNWSPDRRYIAYLMYPPSMLPLRLQIFDLQTKQVTEVASFMKEDVFPKFAWLSATELAFYKGEPLVFDTRVQQTRPLLTTDLLARANHSFPLEHITTAPANGVLALGSSREILLLKWNNGTAQFIRQIDEGLDHTYWALSPDGSLLAYVSALSRQVKIVGVYDSNIFVELPATGRGSPLVEGWSPDGTALLYLDFESLKIVNRDGSGLRQIAGEFGHVRWAPDGSRIIGVGSNGQLLEIAITRQQ